MISFQVHKKWILTFKSNKGDFVKLKNSTKTLVKTGDKTITFRFDILPVSYKKVLNIIYLAVDVALYHSGTHLYW